MSGSEIETEVVLDADGSPVFRAFDAIEKRMKAIQGMVDQITTRAAEAANTFGGANLKTLQNFQKVVSTLERFQTTMQKYDPHAVNMQAIEEAEKLTKQQRAEDEKNFTQAARFRDVAHKDQLDKARQEDKVYGDLARQRKIQDDQWRRQQESDDARAARAAMTDAQKQEKLDELRSAAAQRRILQQDQAQTSALKKEAQLREQNNVKTMRDVAKQQVAEAQGAKELERIQSQSAANIATLRAKSRDGSGTEEDRRRALQMLSIEQDRTRLAETRLKAIQNSTNRTQSSDDRINSALNLRSGRNDERALAAQLDLNGAKQRAADLEASVAYQIERAYNLTGKEKIEAERALRVDEARLQIAQRRAATLSGQAERQAKDDAAALAAANKPQKASGGGLFGNSGIVGAFARTAVYGAAAAAMYGTVSAIKDGIDASIEFQDSLAKIGAVAGLTATQQEKLGDSIREVAANSRFATNEIADATMVLAQAGFSASDIGQSLKQVADLAAAAGVSMSEATDVVTSAIGAFQLQTSETGHIADVLTAALNTTKLNIQQVALGIQYAGQTAYENKISFDELTAAMATMAQAGIKSGSTIGTGLRMFLTDLQSPTKKLADEFKKLGISMEDIDVKTRGLPAVLATLSEKGFSAADAFSGLEKRSAAAYLVLKNNQDVLNKQIVLVNQLGNSADAAAKGSESLSAEWQRFKNQLNEKVADKISPISKWIQDTLHSLNELNGDQTLRKMREQLSHLDGDSDAWTRQVYAIEAYKAALKQNIATLSIHSQEMEQAQTAVNDSTDAFNQNHQTILAQNDAIARLVQHQSTLKANSGALAAETASLMNRFEGLASQLYGTAASYENLLTAMRKVRAESISLGALKANEQAMAYDQSARAKIGQANSLGSLIMGSGLYGRLPKNIQDMIQAGRNPTNPNSSVALKGVYDFAGSRNNGLQGYEADRLRAYVRSLSGAGLDIAAKKQAESAGTMYQYLGGKSGQDILSQVDNLTGKSDKQIQAFIQTALGHAAHAKNDGARQAWQTVAEMAEGKLGSGEAPHAPESKAKRERVNHLPDRQERAADQYAVKADQAELTQAIKGLLDKGGSATGVNPVITQSRTLTMARLNQNLDRITNDKGTGALDKWIDDRTEQVKDQIKQLKLDPNSGQGKDMMADLQREIDAKREDVSRDIGEKISKALDMLVEAVEKTAHVAEEAADHTMNMVQSRVTALQRQNLNGKVPDYVQATVERQAARAKDQNDYAKIAINENQISGLQSAYDQISQVKDTIEQRGLLDKLDPTIKSLDDLNQRIHDLKDSNEELKATFGGEGLIPQGFQANLQMAIENYKEVNHLTASWAEQINMNLTGALDTANGALTQFFDGIISGNQSVAASFRGMVQMVIQYLEKLIVKLIVTKLLSAALNMFAPGSGSGASGILSSTNSVTGQTSGFASGFAGLDGLGFGKIHGGEVTALSGRYITAGVPNRDSVPARIAKGEYVVQKSAVDSVGVDFMHKLNQRGAAALVDMGPKIVVPPPSNQLMNVYVVQPEHQPTLGPNDVLVTIANDIYNGGQTKQLIKQVAQGG